MDVEAVLSGCKAIRKGANYSLLSNSRHASKLRQAMQACSLGSTRIKACRQASHIGRDEVKGQLPCQTVQNHKSRHLQCTFFPTSNTTLTPQLSRETRASASCSPHFKGIVGMHPSLVRFGFSGFRSCTCHNGGRGSCQRDTSSVILDCRASSAERNTP